jgi:hypothetical protein
VIKSSRHLIQPPYVNSYREGLSMAQAALALSATTAFKLSLYTGGRKGGRREAPDGLGYSRAWVLLHHSPRSKLRNHSRQRQPGNSWDTANPQTNNPSAVPQSESHWRPACHPALRLACVLPCRGVCMCAHIYTVERLERRSEADTGRKGLGCIPDSEV